MTAAVAGDFVASLIAGRLARRPRDHDGRPVCDCGELVGATAFECDACAERRKEYDREQRRVALRTQLDEKANRGFVGVPPWEWARHDNPLFRERVKSRRLHAAAERYAPTQNLVLLGPTGIGKTSTAIAALWRLRAAAIAECYSVRSARPLDSIARYRWVTATELVRARREHPLGDGEAPAVDRAARASLLVIDDLGQEREDTVVFEVLDRRYTDRTPVVVTAGMRTDELRARYGEAAWRRLSERGAVIDLWETRRG